MVPLTQLIVMPYSTALASPLSNFEANQDMKMVQDPAVTVSFPALDGDFSYLAWTTTPWTLPSNLALCVHPDEEYVRFLDKKRGKQVIFFLREERVTCEVRVRLA